MSDDYKPMFPWFGGKSTVAADVWAGLGEVDNYVEPFFGSGAVLFLRPHAPRVETVNDADGYVANFWRAVSRDPDAVAEHCDWPVNECDLEARHKWLVQVDRKRELPQRLKDDPDFYDAKIAGWWCWGLSQWIGRGWCAGELHGPGSGENAGRGVHRQRPHLGDAGRGVHSKRANIDTGKGECAERSEWLRDWFRRVRDRLRRVRVCCGDWLRVCRSEGTTTRHGLTGVFLDPPYADTAGRDSNIYAVDCEQVAHRVREWAIERGTDPMMRIVLAGYEGEHDMPSNWRVHAWKANGGYANLNDDPESTGKANAHKERLWFSPHCLGSGPREIQAELFQ